MNILELGPLDHKWFDILTAQTSANEGSGSDQDELCANQEGHFKTPLDKTAVDSQLFSTPKVFRHSRIVSPEIEDEQSFSTTQGNSFRFYYAKHISESLGAQINPDISWTSSLNTPPPVPSTLILCKPIADSVLSSYLFQFVRKLFPSLSNPSRIVVAPPKNDNITTDNHVVSSQTLLTQNEGIWQQILQGANGDGKMASAPDEFQNASSTFLANSSSALRKVKPDRIRRKQFKLSEHDCSSTDISKTNQPNEEHKADEEHSTVPSSPPAKNGSTGISQWSPLNLSEIPPCTAENNILTELQPDFDSRQLVRPPIKITDTGLIRKKRKFVYTVETLKPKVKENETNFQKINTSSGIPDTVQDLDMSQLHKDFAQDFSQISDSGTPTKGVAEDQDHFSPSACLLAMKKAKHQTIQASIHHDYNSISNTGHTSTTNQNYSTNEGTISDSGFQSAVADITHTASSCIVPCSENTGSKTDIHRTTPFPSTHRGNEKSQLLERQTTDGEREGQLDMESTLTQLPSSLKGTDDGHNCIPQNGEVHGRLLEKTNISLPPTHASGFKTASNKGIQISLANLEKARHLFEERNGHQPTKCNSATKRKNSQSNGSMKSTVSVSNQQPSVSEIFEGGSCHLTASQKADVTELCTLLEEADSQFEFTQFRGAEVKQPCQENACFLEKTDKDLDPDFLAGIDFDDSFSSDAEKHLAITAMPDKMTSEHGDASKMEKPNPLMLSVTFKTAGGNALRVSKTCLSKARALFADLEINVSDLNISNKQAAETDAKTKKMYDCHVEEKTWSCFSNTKQPVSALKQARDMQDKDTTKNFENCKIDAITISEEHAIVDTEFENVNTGLSRSHPDDIEMERVGCNTVLEFKNPVSFHENSFSTSKLLPCPASKSIDSSAISELSSGDGFCTASGRKVSVSADAMKKAKCLLNDTYSLEDTTKKISQKENVLRTAQFTAQNKESIPKTSGFDTATGKGVSISSTAHKKAKCPLSESDKVYHKINAKPSHYKIPVYGPPPSNVGFLAASGKKIAFSSKALQKAKALFSDISFSSGLTAEGENVHVSENDLGIGPDQGTSVYSPLPTSGGFHAASGKALTLSSEALQKAKTLFSDIISSAESPVVPHTRSIKHFVKSGSGCTEDKNKQLKKEEASFPLQSGGFQTASGKGLAISSEALKKAKSLLREFDELGDRSGKPSCSKTPVPENGGFLAPSGKPMGLSSEALQKAKTLFSDIISSAESPHQKATLGFSVESEKRYTEDKDKQAEQKNDTLSLQTASGKGVTIASEAAKDAFKFQEDTITPSGAGTLHDCPEEEMQRLLDYEINKESSTKESKVLKPNESSVLNFQSLNLTGCTETQQKFLAQEALDCTKALLEDEGLADHNLLMTLENMPLQHNTSANGCEESEKRRGKRSVEDTEMNGQPPLKRRLLEEFDRSLVDPKASTLHPVKSCSNGLMKDRGVFKYSTSLYPNITRPHRYVPVEAPCFQTDPRSKSAHYKTSAFVPPFVRNAKTETHKNMVLKDSIRTPLAFVPPFKKQRTIVQESSCKAHEGEDKHQKPFVMSSNSKCFVPPTKKTQGAVDGTANLQNTELAQDMQDMRIRKKKRQNIRPLPGSLYLKKTSGVPRIPLKAAVNGKIPGRYTPKKLYGYGVQKYVSNITSENAESFHFSLLQFIKLEAFTDEGGVQLADGGWLVPSNDGTAGKEEFYRLTEAFSKTYSVYVRYDVEVDHSRRPALRKIMEKDDTAAKTLVLCVCDIISRGHSPKTQSHNDTKTPHSADAKVETSAALIWLTDGWYAIKAQLDEPLTAMVHKGRLAVGGKLIIHGAQLVGSQDACSPLEAPESLMLKICANSCRPARWDAKLGFHKDPRPFLLPISCLYSNGGPVGSVDIVVLRSYPMQWMERKPDGSVVFRSSRAEEKEARRYNSHKQKAMEILFAKIQSEFENEEKGKDQRRRKTISHQEIANLQDGEELYEAVGDDPTYLEAHLSAHQLEALHTYRRSLMEKKQAELQDRYHRALEAEDNEMNCPKREVTPVWRLCIADSMEQPGRVYQLNLWRPSSDLQSLLKEGCRFKVYNLTTSDGKKRSCIEPVQLTGTKKTQFQELQASHEWLSTYFQPRVCTNFVNLQNPDFEPLCGEIDLAGYVISVVDGKGSSPAFYLADEKQNFVKVRCFSSLSQTGLEDVVKPRVILALSNLQLRGQSMHPTPVVYAGDLTSFSTNPKEVHLQESFSQLKTLVQCQENFFVTAEEKLSELVRSNGLSSSSSPALQRQTPASLTDRRQDIKSSRNLGSFTPSPTPTSSAEKDPKSLKRRRALDYLSHIPSPPPLSHLGSVASPCVNKTFNPPRRSVTPSTLKTVQTPSHKPADSLGEDEWVNDEELAMIDTQALRVNLI
uniref:BRCA2 DNA repair associated n=1 Tax=Neolamprologus brichardi TaxID=32507 RepID=A0A3Q4IA78_NEOBR